MIPHIDVPRSVPDLGRYTLFAGVLSLLALHPALDVRLPARARCPARRPARLSVIDDPAADVGALARRVTGAISCESLPMNAPSSMTVWCLFSPS